MKLKLQYETEVYVSNPGYFCIRQDNPGMDEDSVVMLSPDQVASVVRYWNSIKAEAKSQWAVLEGDE